MTARVILSLLQASLARPGLEGGPLGRVGRPLARPGVEAHVPVGSLPRPGVESGQLPLLHLSHGSEVIKDLMLHTAYLCSALSSSKQKILFGGRWQRMLKLTLLS